MITHNNVRDTEVERDALLEAIVIRQACRSYNKEARSLETDIAKLAASSALLAGLIAAITLLICWP